MAVYMPQPNPWLDLEVAGNDLQVAVLLNSFPKVYKVLAHDVIENDDCRESM